MQIPDCDNKVLFLDIGTCEPRYVECFFNCLVWSIPLSTDALLGYMYS